ncbi:hypothetical protein OS493_031927 [Desmophyllum pertusum]|uniref:Uncharacterized protein n=1 Tax=Desmophyllum pertusum TaxID=174260 RepID=A0A9X0D6M9_9CNID|nr:hypothetical protein OS493_031927 [Desmophyllum pertusum]
MLCHVGVNRPLHGKKRNDIIPYVLKPQSTRNSTDSPKSVAHDVSRLDGCLPNKAGKEREENGIIQDKGNDRSLNYNLVDASEERKEIIGQHTSEEAEEKEKSVTEGRTGENEDQSGSEEGHLSDFSEDDRPAVGVKEREARGRKLSTNSYRC